MHSVPWNSLNLETRRVWCPIEGHNEVIEKADLPDYPRGGKAISKHNGRLIVLRSDRERDRVQVAHRLGSPGNA